MDYNAVIKFDIRFCPQSLGFVLCRLELSLLLLLPKNSLITNDDKPIINKNIKRTRIQAFHMPNSKAGRNDNTFPQKLNSAIVDI